MQVSVGDRFSEPSNDVVEPEGDDDIQFVDNDCSRVFKKCCKADRRAEKHAHDILGINKNDIKNKTAPYTRPVHVTN